MGQFVDILRVPTPGRGLVEVSGAVLDWLKAHEVEAGFLTLFSRHTSRATQSGDRRAFD
jgi:thiamine phosphate synthase YjbQ (UPF0047 family)